MRDCVSFQQWWKTQVGDDHLSPQGPASVVSLADPALATDGPMTAFMRARAAYQAAAYQQQPVGETTEQTSQSFFCPPHSCTFVEP